MKKALCILSVVCALLSGGVSSSQAKIASIPQHSSAPTMTSLHAAPSANPREIVGFLALAICVGLVQTALVAGAVAYQFPHTLSYDPSDEWEDADYFRALPNALAALSEHHFASAWPRHCNPWSLNRFQRRLHRVLEPLLTRNTRRFVQQHLSAWRWTISHRNTITRFLRIQERENAIRLLPNADPQERPALLALLNTCDDGQLQSPDEATQRQLPRLVRVQTILREHGFSLTVEGRWWDIYSCPPGLKILSTIGVADTSTTKSPL
ncbi:MAG TPA: hypothetical protein VM008_13880 [Phycisphaerae bacterium]|nr:hypothetical protein [Phycisphaerae bacterium]